MNMLTQDEAFAPLNVTSATSPAPDDAWHPVQPVPTDAPELSMGIINRVCPEGYAFTTQWRYLNAIGQLLGCVVRYDRPANGSPAAKQVKLFTFWESPNGKQEWLCKGFSGPRPLYGLDRLAARPDAPVLVVEGEKTADAATIRFKNHVVVTSPGGSNGARKADWSPLKGRRVVIWPDADEPGSKYADAVADLLQGIAISTHVVAIPSSLPRGWDLADNVPPGINDDDIDHLIAAARPATITNGWPAVTSITSTLPPVEPFIPELLPDAIRDYVMDIADRQQSPPDFVAASAICGIAAVVGNRVRVRPKQNDDWEIVPNLWGAIIGRPSAMKSPAMQAALGPVYAISDDLRKKWEEEIKSAEIDDALSNFNAKHNKKKAEKAFQSGDRDSAREILEGLAGGNDDKPPCPRIVVNDATVEKLGELLNENPRGLLLIRDELPGFLANMEREDRQSERAFYLEAFNGDGRFTYDRIGRGTVHIKYCTVSIIGGLQPSRIAPIVRGAIAGTSNDGLIQRFQMVVWPDDMGSWQWVDRNPDASARLAYEQVFRDLYDLPMGHPENPAVLRLSSDSQALFQEWMTEIQSEARSGTMPPTLESHILKMPKTVVSLALLFELIDGGRFEVNERAMRMALGWAEYLRSHANRLYSSGSMVIEDRARLILERCNQLPEEFTARAVHQNNWAGLSDRDVVKAAIELLVSTNHCRSVEKPPTAAGGRPSVTYRWNPILRRA